MKILEFFDSIIDCLNEHSVKYLLVGGHAVNIYGHIRSTADLDLWIDKSEDNLSKLYNALVSFGYDQNTCLKGIEEIKQNRNIGLFDDENNKVDVIQLYSTKLKFQEAYSRKKSVNKGDVTLHVISLDDLIDTKITSGRPRDLEDVKELIKLRGLRKDR
jgi:predicted nucleotidyltransferase